MRHLDISRTLASASRGNKVTGNHALMWPRPGKQQDEDLPFPQPQPKTGLVFPLQMPLSVQNSQTHVKTSDFKNKMDSFAHMMKAQMYDKTFSAERSSNLRSGNEHEPSSACLAEMVHNFIENELSQLCKCGGACRDCVIGNPNGGDLRADSIDESKPSFGNNLSEIIRGFTSGISEIEHALLTDVSNAMTYVKEEGIDFCNEGTECNRGYFKIRAIMKHLRAAGYNAAICKSELYHAGGFPTGEYEYMDVIKTCNSAPQRLIVDFQFRAQFEIARPTDQYSAILGNLPSIFVGEADRLLQIVNVMSDAVKKSLKKNGMYLPPWRKPDYIKAKWFSAYRRTTQNTGPYIKNNDTIVSQDFRRDSKFTTAMELQYQKAGARQAIQELDIDELCIFNPKGSLKRSQADELNGISISRNNCCFDGDKTIIMVTDWQPPLANGRGSGKACKIAGLASALMEAGLTTLSKQQNTINQENNFALPVSRAVAMA